MFDFTHKISELWVFMEEKFVKTVVGLFDTHAHAEAAAHDLEKAGISHDDISLIANNTSGQFGDLDGAPQESTNVVSAEAETGKGAAIGGVAGLLLSLAALAIPGLGVIAAAGWLTTMVTGTLVGAGVGLVGALSGAGIPHDDAAYYNEAIRRGGTLLAARVAEERVDEVAQILTSDGAADINERAEQYRREGFVPGAAHADIESPTVPMNTAADTLSHPAPIITAVATTPPTVPMDTAMDTVPLPVSMDTAVDTGPSPVPNSPAAASAAKPSILPFVTQSAAPAYKSTPAERPTGNVELSRSTHDLKPVIEVRAYELYERRGRGDGLALQDWLMAEQEIGATQLNG